jgi:hypothetical protein
MPFYDRYKVADILQSGDLGRSKLRVECAFDRQHQTHVTHAVPFRHIAGCHFRVDLQVIVGKDILKHFRKSRVDVRFGHVRDLHIMRCGEREPMMPLSRTAEWTLG